MDLIRYREISKAKEAFARHDRVMKWNVKLKLEIITEKKSWSSISEDWNRLVEESNTHIFQTYEWQKAWWKYFGENSKRQNLHILCLYHRERLVGIAPFFIDDFRINGRIKYQCLRLIGSTVMQNEHGEAMGRFTYTDYLDLIICPGYEECVSQKITDYLVKADAFDDILLEEIPEYSVLFSNFIPLIKQQKGEWNVTVKNSSVCPVIKLQNTWEGFLEKLSTEAKDQIRRFEESRKTQDKQSILNTRKITDGQEISAAYDRLVNFHQHHWTKQGRPGAFGKRLKYEFYKEMISIFHERGWAQLWEITAPSEEDQCLAIDLLFVFNNTIYLVQRGLKYTSAFTEFKPENSLLYNVLRESIRDRMDRFDLLRGAEDYAFKPGTHDVQTKNILIRKVRRSSMRLFIYDHFFTRYISMKKRIRFERRVLEAYMKQGSAVFAVGSYINGFFERAILKISHLINGKGTKHPVK
ncbi:MAG: GNAT family N-acetyltransferase [Gracilimonas sp.]|uniref:GNAT family N-acetyltransferase n=1 Tax=Gracilimonas sp. TaxID=1974203 RepID=UPI0019A7B118|nr:GNAT family N-acetyltransferase [Gracilimonas sp.]MBD3615442.1 GNAT family N-acetyltransferase [Gracilimonas sp.]